tara:strand:+ start:3968 stop:4954 length:987 start_codon:yes stop_codon:yes gene_type:complete
MRMVRFGRLGGPEVLQFEYAELADPGRGQLQIEVKAIGLNRAEALMRAGSYIQQPSLPAGLGLEAAGIVTRLGEGVDGFVPGEAVSVIPATVMAEWPTYAEYINVPVERVVAHPPNLTWEEAAAAWMQYLTAYGALIQVGNLQAGEAVAITAASSSVGLAAIQIANALGALTVACTRKNSKRQALLDAGATHVIVTESEDLASRLKEIVGEVGVKLVLDPIGGPIFEPLVEAMGRGGMLIEYGGLSGQPTPFPLPKVLAKSLTLRGYLVHEVIADPEHLAVAKRYILDGMASGALRPILARTFPFEHIVEAHRYLESNAQVGKIVVTV